MLGVEVLGLVDPLDQGDAGDGQGAAGRRPREMLQKADEAIYARRNTAVELERRIKENELNTEIAVEEKRRTVRETKMRADIAVEQERRSWSIAASRISGRNRKRGPTRCGRCSNR